MQLFLIRGRAGCLLGCLCFWHCDLLVPLWKPFVNRWLPNVSIFSYHCNVKRSLLWFELGISNSLCLIWLGSSYVAKVKKGNLWNVILEIPITYWSLSFPFYFRVMKYNRDIETVTFLLNVTLPTAYFIFNCNSLPHMLFGDSKLFKTNAPV